MASLRRIPNANGNLWEVRWRDHRTGKQPHRLYATRELADRAFAEALRIVAIEDIEDILNTADSKLAEESVKKLRRTLNVVFKFGVQRRYLDTNPVTGARITANCRTARRARKIHRRRMGGSRRRNPEATALWRVTNGNSWEVIQPFPSRSVDNETPNTRRQGAKS